MVRRRCRKDANHDEIAATFRALGVDWIDTWQHAQYTPGFPDGVAVRGQVVRFVEIKSAPGDAKRLTRDEILFWQRFDPLYRIVATVEDALAVAKEMGVVTEA